MSDSVLHATGYAFYLCEIAPAVICLAGSLKHTSWLSGRVVVTCEAVWWSCGAVEMALAPIGWPKYKNRGGFMSTWYLTAK
ncbi:hypothetical protein K402DRAFT_273488 [Aulographum hederae CBS 113979]|uniref:Uncharacterized protein n=1 Tax=Aulographum hederae CBS 113979 TaxID=1176131 RepID=A0A6G1H8E4_9PEZI|nr:hypothetical protein K402DRAFT_273488 [Aulographum hederae CBS 113979]